MVAFFQLKACRLPERPEGLTKTKNGELALSGQAIYSFSDGEVSQKLTKKGRCLLSHFGQRLGPKWQRRHVDFHLGRRRFYSKPFYYSLHEAQLLQHLQ